MPESSPRKKAKRAAREGKSPSTQAGEFVREEIHHVREGKHGARNTKQAIAIGLSKARRAGVKLPPGGSRETRKQASRDLAKGRRRKRSRASASRSRASTRRLRREGRAAASSLALSRQARRSAKRRGAKARSRAARKAVRTKGPVARRAAARKAARTRARRR
jgi:hypothetical protein